jgi:F0F1-type ATP synthase assembly protein I
MPLGLGVLLVVLGFTAAVAAVGWMIDKSAERADREPGSGDAREDGHQT